MTYNSGGTPRICAIDCGLKYNQIRCLVNRGARVDLVPWDHKINVDEYDGLFLSNGPGDPKMCQATIEHIKNVIKGSVIKPIFGICLGHQLLSVAIGCTSYKMKYLTLNFCFFFLTQKIADTVTVVTTNHAPITAQTVVT